MAINIDTLVHNEFGRSASDQLARLTGKPTGKVQSGVASAITEVLDGFSMKARDEAGRQSLYEAARYCDDGLIDDPAVFFGSKDERAALADSNGTLSALLGAGRRDAIADAVRRASDLDADEADMVTGYVTPGVLGVMKRQMLNGAVLDNSDGIGQMLLGEVTSATVGGAGALVDHSVPKSAPRQTHTQTTHASSPSAAARTSTDGVSGGATGGGAAASHDNESDLSWLFRWALPFLLLGGLVLAGVKNCGMNNMAGIETSAQKLVAVRAESDGLKGQITALTAERDQALSDRETAVGEIDRLKGELDTVSADTTEVDAANAEIATLKEQLAQPADTSELDAANTEIATLKEQLAQPVDTSEIDAANAEIASLKDQLAQPADTSALDAANAEIVSLKSQIVQPADGSALNAEILSLKNQLANVPAPVDNSAELAELKGSVEDGQLKIAQLESEIGTVRESRAELEASMADINSQNIKAEARAAELKDKLLNVAGAKNRMEADLESSSGKVKVMQANLNRAVDDATAKRKALVASASEINGLKDSIGALQQDSDEKRKALSSRLSNAIAFSKGRGQQLEETNAKLAKVTKGRSAAIKTVTDLSGKLRASGAASGELQAQLAESQQQFDTEREKRLALSTRLSNAIAFSKTRGSQIDLLQQESDSEREKRMALSSRLSNAIAFSKDRGQQLEVSNAQLVKVTKGRGAAIKTVTDLAGKLRASELAGGALQVQLAESQAQIDSEREKRMALSSRLSNAIAFSKDRATQIDALTGEKQGLESEIAASDAAMQAQKDRVASVSASLADELAAAGLGNVSVSPVEDSQAVGITMGSSDLYGVGSASLSPQGNDMLSTVGSIVGSYGDWRIDVEGHTDGQPIGSALQKKYPSNWELSTARAAAAVRYMQFNLGIPAENMSVRGFGEHRPLATNETSEGREANRRIELILRN